MQELLNKIPELVQAISLIGMCISLLATVIVRLTPSKTDDEKLGVFMQKFLKVLSWLPTIGVNPQTKKLQEAYEELKAKSDEQVK